MKIQKISKILRIAVIIAIIIIMVALAIFSAFFFRSLTPVDLEDKENVEFVVESGWGKGTIADALEDAGLIRSAFFFKVYVRLNDIDNLMAGTYSLSASMTVDDIVNVMSRGDNLENKTVTVTFVEGRRFPYYVSKISESMGFLEEDIYALTSNTEYLESLISKYWFLSEEILDPNIYYPLEGYLFPDTYEFRQSATIEEVLDKMLTEMGDKLKVYEDELKVSNYSIHDLLTLASMVELEAVTADDRRILAGVFYNRLNSGWTLGSDVTTYYAAKKDMTESLTTGDLNDCNAYNTRGTCVAGLPVGPICSPSYSSITASIEPEESDYYYFVADKTNAIYFARTEAEHLANIAKLREEDLWPE